MRRLFLLAFAFLALALLPGALYADTNDATALDPVALQQVASKIESHVLAQLQNGGTSSALIVFSEQADVSAAKNLRTKQEKGAFVVNTLRATATRTQARVRAELERLGIPYRPYYIANLIAVENLNAQAAARIAARRQVMRIVGNPAVRLNEPLRQAPTTESVSGNPWNIVKIGADRAWAKGIRGQGIVVANQDTGVQWNHPALKKKYRGYNTITHKVNHNYNWWDAVHHAIGNNKNPCGFSVRAPCDDSIHGTHTMGTLVGRAPNNRIGVAPGAKWMACRNMDQNVGQPSTYLECFEFFLAPWNLKGENPRPGKAPDVVSNSWYCPPSEFCDTNTLKIATENLRAAGIFVAVAAGNFGSSCSSVSDPPALYDAATTVGATDMDDNLAIFSSRGPVTRDGSNRLKPDISAPGVHIRSSTPPNNYRVLEGTSMAAPHLAGAVALLWQAKPFLRGDMDATETLLFQSSNPKVHVNDGSSCGSTSPTDIPNNFFGYGRLDIFAALNHAP